MSEHVLNLYKIKNAAELSAHYRLVDIDGPFGEDDLAEQNLGVLAKRIAYANAIPVAIVGRGDKTQLAIPADTVLSELEYQLTPDVVTLRPQDETAELAFGELSPLDEFIALSFLGFSLRSPLRNERELWSAGANTYLFRRPANFRRDGRDVDIFEGFSFRLLRMEGRLYVSVSLTVKYIANKWLTEHRTEGEIRAAKRRRFLYHFGNAWYMVQLLGLSGKSISEQRFTIDGSTKPISVYDYTLRECGETPPSWIQQLDPLSPAITYQNPGNEKKRYGAAALCKAVLSMDDPAVRSVHNRSISPPEERFEQTGRIVKRFFGGRAFGAQTIAISAEPFATRGRAFRIPALRFGQGRVIRVGTGENNGDVRIQELGRARMGLLLDVNGGMVSTNVMDAQYAIFPSDFHPYADDYRERQEKTIRQFLHAPYQLTPVVYDNRETRTLKSQVDSIMDALTEARVEGGHGILVLPENAHAQLHNYIKRRLRDRLSVQCVSARAIRAFYELRRRQGAVRPVVPAHVEGKFASYLRYAGLGLLLVNRQTPFCLESPRPVDLSIGLDVYRGTAAFVFVHRQGERYFVRLEKSQQKEKLLRQQVRDITYRELQDQLQLLQYKPRSVLMRRDGKSFYEEWLGFRDAIQQLIRDGLLPPDVRFGIVEVHKTFVLGLRLVERVKDERLRNAGIGSWHPISGNEAILCNTGFPFKLCGTVKPLLLRVIRGDIGLQEAAQDTFMLSLLSWPVPDRCIRLPIDLKLCDDQLRAVCGEADDDEATYGEEYEEAGELEQGKVPAMYQ